MGITKWSVRNNTRELEKYGWNAKLPLSRSMFRIWPSFMYGIMVLIWEGSILYKHEQTQKSSKGS